MAKALLVFSDGTGNKGGVTKDTNVWRLYQMIERTHCPQLSFYDDGVGTQNYSPLKLLASAVGWGLSQNIREAYAFLARNYEPGDCIYLFGFSRGAYTVRALLGMINACGLVSRCEPNGEMRTYGQLDKKVDEAFRAYRSVNEKDAPRQCRLNLPVTVQFIGVWDTVEAVGLPGSAKLLSALWGRLTGQRTYGFHDREVHGVRVARHALSIDDERSTFRPNYWSEAGTYQANGPDESGEHRVDLQQVWFAGVHSNVGGGYPKDGLAYISLDWIIAELQKCCVNREDGQMRLQEEAIANVRDLAHDGDLLYDSRAGVGMLYRYKPRRLASFADDTRQPIQVHVSVPARICKRVNNYAPLFIEQSDRLIDVGQKGEVGVVYTDHEQSNYRKGATGAVLAESLTREGRLAELERTCSDKLARLANVRTRLFAYFVGLLLLAVVLGFSADPLKNWTQAPYEEVVHYNAEGCYRVPPLSARRLLVTLREDKACAEVLIQADSRNRTGIWLEAGRPYQFRLAEVENWSDWRLPASPQTGRPDRGLGTLLRYTTYAPAANYLELVGLVDGRPFPLGRLASLSDAEEGQADEPEEDPPAEPDQYRAAASGELQVLANEPVWLAWFRTNNTGTVTLRVEAMAIPDPAAEETQSASATATPDTDWDLRPWLASTLKALLPSFAERLVDNAFSYWHFSVLWLLGLLIIYWRSRHLSVRIHQVARRGWDSRMGIDDAPQADAAHTTHSQ